MLCGIFDLNWFEGARSDMEEHFGARDTALGERVEKLGREVEAGRRRGDRPALLREYGLISLRIARRVGALDVRRERDMPKPLDRVVERGR